ncbi:DUF1826 domain-containing protein [Polymorphobacter sp.]|uniref:DUF1826 domain-containing protein n=1 Tax=Polymorphobacter sp. TaxID=1909290 RepID=UPI003F6F8B9F
MTVMLLGQPVLAAMQAGGRAEVLAMIRAPSVNLAVWQRRLPARAACEAVKLVVGATGEVRVDSLANETGPMLVAAMQAAGWPALPALSDDVAALAGHFAGVMGAERLSVRLEIVTGDACRKFHADYVTARLISSYAGPGSEWLDDAEPNARVRRLAAGDVALFKGRLWSETPVIHRSPPIAGTGQRRLVLVIDVAE